MSQDVFERWGIKHLSPSSINLYISDPSLWIIRYLLKLETGGSSAMARGSAVDNALGSWFGLHPSETRRSITQCQMDGLKSMDDFRSEQKKKGFWDDEKHYEKFNKERELLPRYIKTAIDFYSDFDDRPSGYQEKVIYESKKLPIPIVGYLDLIYESDGIVRDIKTVSRKVSENTFAINRQLSLYGYVKGMLPIADYILVNKSSTHVESIECSNVEGSLDELERGALAIMKFLSISDDINDLLSLHFPNFDDFKWSDLRKEKDIRSLWRK